MPGFRTFWLLYFLLAQALGGLGLMVWLSLRPAPDFTARQALARRYLLTDFCLSTESRHVRHPNFPEWMAPFQDLPGGHEHFPSSSFISPPAGQF
ncbi:MAG: hypothetical protein OHK0053_32630 [Microscillaceae bacterium]